MLRCDNLIKVYLERRVVDDLSFQVEDGEVFALLRAMAREMVEIF